MDLIRNFLLTFGCEEKNTPGKVSMARLLAALWGLTAAGVAVMMVLVLGEADHMLVAELAAASLTALGLRSRSK